MTSLFGAPGDLVRVESIMGLPVGIDVRDEDVDPSALDIAFDYLRWVDATFSTYRTESVISRLNSGEITLADAPEEVAEVLSRCEQLRFQTGGYFDARAAFQFTGAAERLPDALASAVEPAGYVKGWAVDRAAGLLAAAGAHNYSINAGGDIRVKGGALPDPIWLIGIQHPYISRQVAAVVAGDDLAIATSGTYARGEHIADPVQEEAPTGVLSVTITGPDLGTADAFATAVFAMGPAGPEWAVQLVGSGYEAMIVLEGDQVLFTPGFPRAEPAEDDAAGIEG